MAELTDTQVADLVAAIDCDYHAPSYGQCSACADRIERTAEMVAEIATEHVTAALDEIEAVVRHWERYPALRRGTAAAEIRRALHRAKERDRG